MSDDKNLARRSIEATFWNIIANTTSAGVFFVRSVILARLLPVEIFGIYAFPASVVALGSVFCDFGIGSAFLHRAAETEDIESASAAHFTLKSLLAAIWLVLFIFAALIFTAGQEQTAFLLLIVTTAIEQLTFTPRTILVRRVIHRRLALIQLLDSIFTTLVAVFLAWQGVTLWALLSSHIISVVLNVVGLYVWKPVWRPRLKWSPATVKYFLGFGRHVLIANLLARALDRVDDLWTGIYLGKTSLGFYSRAYSFATYPRKLLAQPLNMVAGGTYAELKEDRQRLSKAFFRVNAFLIRSGFFIGGILFLIAPEFICLVLGAKWLPMLDAFRLMLIFTLFDPMKGTISSLLSASVGRPELVIKSRFLQLVILILGLWVLGPHLGILGVALAVDVMLVVGIMSLLRQASKYVDFSLKQLLLVPLCAVVLSVLLALGVVEVLRSITNDWLRAFVKTGSFLGVYTFIFLIFEGQQLRDGFMFFSKMIERDKN